MPYTGTKRIKQVEKREIMPEKQGDLCALAFKPMVEKWLANPSWTTWSRIRLEVHNGMWKKVYFHSRKETWMVKFTDADVQNQIEAAAEVFYSMYVFPYEIDKKKTNGGVLDCAN